MYEEKLDDDVQSKQCSVRPGLTTGKKTPREEVIKHLDNEFGKLRIQFHEFLQQELRVVRQRSQIEIEMRVVAEQLTQLRNG